MAGKQNASSVLAARLIERLRARRLTHAPATLRGLAEEIEAGVAPALLLKAANTKTFLGSAVVVRSKDIDSPVALKEDGPALVKTDEAFAYLVRSACTPKAPLIACSSLRTRATPSLRAIVQTEVDRRLRDESLPEGVALVRQGARQLFHWTAYPLPRDPAEQIAEECLERLRHRREKGDYPTTLGVILAAIASEANATVVKKALATARFKNGVVLGMTAAPVAPLALAEDRDVLAQSDLLFMTALTKARTTGHQVLSLAEIKRKVTPALQAAFAASLGERCERGRLPSAVATLRCKNKTVFFLLEDLPDGPRPARTPAGRDTGLEGERFRREFEEEFTRLDREKGSHNFVSLRELRNAMPVPREVFDRELRTLRLAGRFTLSAAEGRHGLSAEDQAAGILEQGALMLYVSRRVASI